MAFRLLVLRIQISKAVQFSFELEAVVALTDLDCFLGLIWCPKRNIEMHMVLRMAI